MIEPEPTRVDQLSQRDRPKYSICTIVSRMEEYQEMVRSFRGIGFRAPDCEFLYIDNTQGNKFDAYRGNNLLIDLARGDYIVLCHQDILLLDHGREQLDAVLDELTRLDPTWAVCGNAGGHEWGHLVLNITDAHGVFQKAEEYPVRVGSLDENFLVMRRSANLALSRDLSGFHFYGTDLCIVADILGYNCYVINFHLRHKSPGNESDFQESRNRMVQKYTHAFRTRWIRTTCTNLFITGHPVMARILNTKAAGITLRFIRRLRARGM